MMHVRTFEEREAPCGKKVSAESYRDEKEEAWVTHRVQYSCGCVHLRLEYHDGSVAQKVVHHSGKVLVDELLTAE